MGTKLWEIEGCPGWTVEQTLGAWALWGPCICVINSGESKEDCASCGGVGEVVKDTCGMKEDGAPSNPRMLLDILPSAAWTPRRIQ